MAGLTRCISGYEVYETSSRQTAAANKEQPLLLHVCGI